jgi:hypothetical protein
MGTDKSYFWKESLNSKSFRTTLKIVLSIFLFLCLLKMPYGFYQLVRFVAMVGFAILAYQANERQDKTETIIYTCLTILFQPWIKIALGRQIWNIVDIVVGVGLITSIFIKKALSEHGLK